MLTYAYVMISSYLVTTFRREEGQGMAEYGLILALVAVAAAAAFTLLSEQISTLISTINDKMAG